MLGTKTGKLESSGYLLILLSISNSIMYNLIYVSH